MDANYCQSTQCWQKTTGNNIYCGKCLDIFDEKLEKWNHDRRREVLLSNNPAVWLKLKHAFNPNDYAIAVWKDYERVPTSDRFLALCGIC